MAAEALGLQPKEKRDKGGRGMRMRGRKTRREG
jgi:hypothetical protein